LHRVSSLDMNSVAERKDIERLTVRGFMIRGILLGLGLLVSPLVWAYGDVQEYQIGSEWGKRRIWSSHLEGQSRGFQRAAQATAYLTAGATGFYLGQYAGVHVLATNHHVCPRASDCVGQMAQFRLLGLKFKVVDYLLTLKSLDLTLLAIQVSSVSEADKLLRVAAPFAFRTPVRPGQLLMTFGFGVANNPQNYLVGNTDEDCRVFSKTGDYRKTADPDRFNPVKYKAWSFVHGCDISHGDSGSALVDRATGAVVGILWTGKFPKAKRIQDSQYLDRLLKTGSEEIWEELNFGVPSTIIGELLRDVVYATSTKTLTKRVVAEMLSKSGIE
jgi:hypothetical protein